MKYAVNFDSRKLEPLSEVANPKSLFRLPFNPISKRLFIY